MVDVVTALPPPERQATAKVGDKQANQSIRHELASDCSVACIVRREHDLVLQDVRQYCIPGEHKPKTKLTQKRPRKIAEVMYHSCRRATMETVKRME